jgi:hypothetical protein
MHRALAIAALLSSLCLASPSRAQSVTQPTPETVAVSLAGGGDHDVAILPIPGGVDVVVDGVDHIFTGIICVYLDATAASGSVTFGNSAPVMTYAVGGTGINDFAAGPLFDLFVGGLGANTLHSGGAFSVLIGGNGDTAFDLTAGGSGVLYGSWGSNAVVGSTAGWTVVNF